MKHEYDSSSDPKYRALADRRKRMDAIIRKYPPMIDSIAAKWMRGAMDEFAKQEVGIEIENRQKAQICEKS